MAHARTTDLNLLTALEVLLEERHISRAAEQYNLSQPAMSPTLQRLRGTFDDELLVRTATGYELTPRARAIQRELGQILPRINALLHGDRFDPTMATDVLNLSGTDYAAIVVGGVRDEREPPPPCLDPGRVHHDVDRAPVRVDFLDHRGHRWLIGDVGAQGEHLGTQFAEPAQRLVAGCEATAGHQRDPGGAGRGEVLGDRQPHPARTAPQPGIRVVAAPKEIKPFPYYMAWHPRLDGDMTNRWLRDTVREVTSQRPGR